MSAWLVAFAGTLAIELPIVAALRSSRSELARWLATAALANALTHPLAWLAVGSVGWSAAESGVLALEVLAYRSAIGTGWRRACVVALAANGASGLVALV